MRTLRCRLQDATPILDFGSRAALSAIMVQVTDLVAHARP